MKIEENMLASLKEQLSQHDTEVRDDRGIRYFKCKCCDAIGTDKDFASYGGPDKTSGICRKCARIQVENEESAVCTLDSEVNTCPFFEKDGSICTNRDRGCGFRQTDQTEGSYVRKERWYEKYYRKDPK